MRAGALLVASAGALVAAAGASPPSAGNATLAPEALQPLPLGAIAPQGWLLDQLVRQASSLSGHLAVTRNLGGYHGDSNVVNQSRWLGGPGGGPWFISSNDQWFPYWANGNVPLASLLRASGALGRLPAALPLGDIVDGFMRYILDHDTASGWIRWKNTSHNKWSHGNSLDEGGFEMVLSLTQWAEDRPAADRKRVARAVIAHLLHEGALITRSSIVSWTATRWPTFVTLVGIAVDRLLPEFGDDPSVVPLGRAKTEQQLVTAAQNMGKYGFDHYRYYHQLSPTARTGNKSFPNGAVSSWNVYDHGVNNAEGAMRWPSALYRLNHSRAEGEAAMATVLGMLDEHQGQINGNFCADEVFCGRNPNRGTETCTVVEQMASLELSFATFADPALYDRVERLAFNALPAALTGDMWTHVYVQQANSVFAGVSHPRAESHSDHAHHEHTVKTSCERASCSDPIEIEAGAGGGPAPFSEIETTNYFGTSHFPCCITNFPQGWPKFAQSTVFFEPSSGAIVLASLVPLHATIAAAGNATLKVQSGYPFTDTANISVTAVQATVLKLRIPVWATRATVNGTPVPNGTLHAVPCAAGAVTTVHVDLRPEIIWEHGWGAKQNDTAASELDTELVWSCKPGGLTGDTFHRANLTIADAQKWCAANSKCGGFCTQHAGACGDTGLGVLDMHFSDKWGAHRPTKDSTYSSWTPSAGPSQPSVAANAVGVSRGSLVFALHPRENRTVVRWYNSTPAIAGQSAPDYEIKTAEPWNYALVPTKGASFNRSAVGWSPAFAFNDSAGAHPFAIKVTGRRVPSWGFWRGSNITDPPPASPVDCVGMGCGAEEELVLVPLGSTNIRISVFPWAHATSASSV